MCALDSYECNPSNQLITELCTGKGKPALEKINMELRGGRGIVFLVNCFKMFWLG